MQNQITKEQKRAYTEYALMLIKFSSLIAECGHFADSDAVDDIADEIGKDLMALHKKYWVKGGNTLEDEDYE